MRQKTKYKEMIKSGKKYVELCNFDNIKEHEHIDINYLYIDTLV